MGEKTSRYLDNVIRLAQSTFEQVEFETNSTPERSILNIRAEYGSYRIFVTELFSDELRKYRYTERSEALGIINQPKSFAGRQGGFDGHVESRISCKVLERARFLFGYWR